MKILILLLLVSGLALAADCTGPCGCDSVAGHTQLNISVYDDFGPIPPLAEDRLIWIEYEKGEIIRETIWDGWNKPNTTDDMYKYKVPSCVDDPVSDDYYIYFYGSNASCRQEYSRLMHGRKTLLANEFEWNGSVYSDECVSGYQFKLIRSYFESSVPLYIYPDRYSKYTKEGEACSPAFLLIGLAVLAYRSS
jgi:hypothetical protein